MAAPMLRDIAITPPRSGAAGSEVRVQECRVRCWTGRGATPCSVVADYGPTTAYGSTTPPTPPGGAHELLLGDLTPGVTYHLRLTATDPTDAPNPTQSQDHSWLQTPDLVPPGPSLTAIAAGSLTATGATITWTTDPACPNGQVNYATTPAGVETSPTVASESGSGTRTSHSVAITGLVASTRYYYRVFQVAPDGSSTLSALRTFVTTA
jgi:purple acid phosphatase-like protein